MLSVFIFAIIIAIVVTAIFSYGFKNTGPWGNIWVFFAIIFLVALVAGEWTTPVGPAIYGIYWIPVMFITLVIAFIIAASTPTPGGMRPFRRKRKIDSNNIENENDINPEAETTAAISVFVYVIIILLIIAAIAGWFR